MQRPFKEAGEATSGLGVGRQCGVGVVWVVCLGEAGGIGFVFWREI